jgi:hypothetical protein
LKNVFERPPCLSVDHYLENYKLILKSCIKLYFNDRLKLIFYFLKSTSNGIDIGDIKRDNPRNNPGDSDTYLLTLANRNDPICVASSKVDRASTISVAVAVIIAGIIALTFFNVNAA